MDGIELLQSAIRSSIVITINVLNMIMFCNVLMKRRRSLCILTSFFVFRAAIWKTAVDVILSQFYFEELWYQLVRHGGILFFAIGTFVTIYITYEGGLLKTAIGGIIAEILSTICGFGCINLVNTLMGRNVEAWMVGEFYSGDVLLVFCIVSGARILKKGFGKWLQKYQGIQIRYAGLWWSLIMIYQVLGYLDQLAMPGNKLDEAFTYSYVSFSAIGIWTFVLLFFVGLWETKQVRRENEYLNVQKRLSQEYFSSLRQQETIIRKYQSEIDRQIQDISRIEFEGKKEEIQKYLNDLRKKYQEMRYGEYCESLVINALINNELKKMENEKVDVEINFRNIEFTKMQEEALTVIISEIFGYAQKDTCKIVISISEMKKKLCINYKIMTDKEEIVDTVVW